MLSGLAAMLLTGSLQAQQKNVLFIAIDDLRPELGCYGHPVIKSPNIDQLAASGVRFNRSYTNIAVCGASRASILSGVRPGKTRFVGHDCYLDQHLPGTVNLPMHFRNNGYQTISLGKVFHHQNDSKGSWDLNWRPEIPKANSWRDYQLAENIAADTGEKSRGMPYEKADVADEAYFDGKTTAKAIAELQACSKSGKPFFMAVGFLKPHLPFNAPAKYWDLYPKELIRRPENMEKPMDAPEVAMHNFGELRAYAGIPATGPVSDEMALKLIQGYYACVSYFEKALHVPLIIKAPGHKTKVVVNKLVELVDVYPTLCELTELTSPFQLQGNSLVPLLDGGNPPWKEAVFARWVKGETIITASHAYTEWTNNQREKPFARMLYNHSTDADENTNVSELKENKQLVEELHFFKKFPALFRASYAMLKYSFPNLTVGAFGDTGRASQSAESLEIGLIGAVKYNQPELPEMLASMKKLIDGGI